MRAAARNPSRLQVLVRYRGGMRFRLPRLVMFGALDLLLWLGRGEAADDPVGYALVAALLLGLTAWVAARPD